MTFRIEAPGTTGPLEFVYLEEHHEGKYLDASDDVDLYHRAWSRLIGSALDPVASRDRGSRHEVRRVAEVLTK
ncbi:Scr1 family TA system antitoxin-like transcriptional regulator [Saccharopolyspora sp. NPDC002376]